MAVGTGFGQLFRGIGVSKYNHNVPLLMFLFALSCNFSVQAKLAVSPSRRLSSSPSWTVNFGNEYTRLTQKLQVFLQLRGHTSKLTH
jgi:hypothetical protein